MTAVELPVKGASSELFTPLTIANGKIQLKHRIVLSPCTRNRGIPFTETTSEALNRIWLPDALTAEYYGQRASEGGLLVTEGVTPSPEGGAMPGVPGMWLEEQAKGWKLVCPLALNPSPSFITHLFPVAGHTSSPRKRRHHLRANLPPRPRLYPPIFGPPHCLLIRYTLVHRRKISLSTSRLPVQGSRDAERLSSN
jgi:hypothetical protein